MTDLTILAGSAATINSPTSFTLNSNTDKIGTVEFLTLAATGIYLEFVMPVGIDGQPDTIYVGLNKKTGPSEPPSNPFYVKLYEDSGSNFEIYINDTIINDFSGKYNAGDLLSVYFDGTTVSCCLNGIVINTPRSFPNDGSSYRLCCWMENSLSSKTIHRVKFYPTGLLGPTGPTGPAGLGFTTITGNTSSVAIYYNRGNVAIGQTASQYALDISGDLQISNNTIMNNTINRVFINGVSWINSSNVAIDYTYGSNYFIDDSIFGNINQNYTLTIDNLNTDISNSKMNISTLCNIYDTYVAAYYANNIIVNGTAYTPKFFGGCVYVQPMNSTVVQDYIIYNISGSLTVLTSVSQYSPLI
jgi:hypothetical protein